VGRVRLATGRLEHHVPAAEAVPLKWKSARSVRRRVVA
jgi:hypothetical protein